MGWGSGWGVTLTRFWVDCGRSAIDRPEWNLAEIAKVKSEGYDYLSDYPGQQKGGHKGPP